MSKNISSQLRDFISQEIKDGKIDPVLKESAASHARVIEHAVATKNKKKLVKAIRSFCELFLGDE